MILTTNLQSCPAGMGFSRVSSIGCSHSDTRVGQLLASLKLFLDSDLMVQSFLREAPSSQCSDSSPFSYGLPLLTVLVPMRETPAVLSVHTQDVCLTASSSSLFLVPDAICRTWGHWETTVVIHRLCSCEGSLRTLASRVIVPGPHFLHFLSA